jgi:transcriptional regulator with XRE-family HTH domain
MEHALDALRGAQPMADVDLARRSGVSRSTMHRIGSGQASPTLRTLREIAIAVGFDIDLRFVPLSDRAAARAARLLLDDAFVDSQASAEDREWMLRLRRLAGDDPISTLTEAASASSLLHRTGTIGVAKRHESLRLASAGDATKSDWALSGSAALAHMASPGDHVSDAPDILYVEDVNLAWRLMESPDRTSAASAKLIIAPCRPEHDIDAWTVGRMRLVAPIQVLLDSIGLGGELAGDALQIARSW